MGAITLSIVIIGGSYNLGGVILMFSTKLPRKILDFDAKIGQIRTPPNYYAESTLIFFFHQLSRNNSRFARIVSDHPVIV